MRQRLDDIRARLLSAPQQVAPGVPLKPDFTLADMPKGPPVPAAVLIGLVKRGNDFSVLYTERSARLRAHSGQISFPGGKMDATDESPAHAAIREAHEEVAVQPDDVEILGYLPFLFSGTNFLITPVVALVEPSAPFIANPDEVASFFEVPFEVLQRNESYQTFDVSRGTHAHKSWRVEHEKHIIWGITASITRRFYEIALAENGA